MAKKQSSPENRPLPAEITEFEPVPRRFRTNSWTVERQKAFILALAETASVGQAAEMVNMSKVSCYNLRNHKDSHDFKRAWDAAVDFSVSRLKDIAFQRAVEGRLEPVWQGGKLVGHKRVYSDAMLMFLLRQYGTDDSGKNVTVNYVRTRANVDARDGSAGAAAEATTMTVRSSKPALSNAGKQDRSAQTIAGFEGVVLDEAAHAQIAEALKACAERQRTIGGSYEDNEVTSFTSGPNTPTWIGSFEPPYGWVEEVEPFDPAEPSWQSIGDERYSYPFREEDVDGAASADVEEE
jgi:hypothetical protein